MKKTLTLSAFLLFAGLICAAAPVTSRKAQEFAGKFFGTPAGRTPRMVVDIKASSTNSVSDTPSYYVFNNDGGGFVIVAGDDRLSPVIGYSENGSFDASRMPSNLRAWLDGVDASVRLVRKYDLPRMDQTARAWDAGFTASNAASEGVLLELPEWSQENPYNWYCPIITQYENEKALTGCVATAIGMVMRYHQWPPCGTGTLPDYNMTYYLERGTTTVPMKGHKLGHEYKWDLMPMEDFYSETVKTPTEGEKQVAWLLWDLGIMMQAEYSSEGTGAYSEDIPAAMKTYMYYKNARYQARDNYSGDWSALLKGQIDRNLPILYGANSNEGGHQFLIHGYDASGNFYVNWGWSGECNGYFDIDYLYPYKDIDLSRYGYSASEIKQMEEDSIFSSDHDAIIDLEPDRSVSPVPVEQDEPEVAEQEEQISGLYLKAGTVSGRYNYTGVFLSSGSVLEPGASMLLNGGLVYNNTSTSYTGYFRFDLTDWQGEYISTLGRYNKSKTAKANNGYTYVFDISCTAPSVFRLGDKIGLFTSTSQSGNYTQVPWVSDGVTVGEIPLVPMYFIDPDSDSALINSNEAYESVEWTISGNTKKAVITYSDGSVETIVLGL